MTAPKHPAEDMHWFAPSGVNGDPYCTECGDPEDSEWHDCAEWEEYRSCEAAEDRYREELWNLPR